MSKLPVGFIHELDWQAIPSQAQSMARQCLLDLLGVAASGTQTGLSRIIANHSLQRFAWLASPAGAALAKGMTIDSVDVHDSRSFESDPTEADGDPESPLAADVITTKFHRFASPVLGETRVADIASTVHTMGGQYRSLKQLYSLIYPACS